MMANPGEGITPKDLKTRWAKTVRHQEVVEFYGHSSGIYRCFSNFYSHKSESFLFTVPDHLRESVMSLGLPVTVRCAFSEKAIMLCKAAVMGDAATYSEIVKATQPAKAKALGRKVRDFDPERWDEVVCSVAFEVVRQKFQQTPSIQKVLLGTGDKLIAEATVNDANWGIGINVGDPRAQTPAEWRGSNILGWALMEAREAIRSTLAGEQGVVQGVSAELSPPLVIDLDGDGPAVKRSRTS